MKTPILFFLAMLFSLAAISQEGGADHFKLRTDYLELANDKLELLDPLSVKVLAVDANGVVGYTTASGGSGDGVWQSATSVAAPYISYNVGLGDLRVGSPQDPLDLYASGKIYTTEVIVQASVPVPDYVFEKSYKLRPLGELEDFIAQHKHLPEIPSANEVAGQGLGLSEMNLLLLKKVEELTLYLIEQEKEINQLKRQVSKLEVSR